MAQLLPVTASVQPPAPRPRASRPTRAPLPPPASRPQPPPCKTTITGLNAPPPALCPLTTIPTCMPCLCPTLQTSSTTAPPTTMIPNYQGGPTVFDPRGAGPSLSIPPG